MGGQLKFKPSWQKVSQRRCGAGPAGPAAGNQEPVRRIAGSPHLGAAGFRGGLGEQKASKATMKISRNDNFKKFGNVGFWNWFPINDNHFDPGNSK